MGLAQWRGVISSMLGRQASRQFSILTAVAVF